MYHNINKYIYTHIYIYIYILKYREEFRHIQNDIKS